MTNTNDPDVFTNDDTVIIYPEFKKCFFDSDKTYPELKIISENHDAIVAEYENIKDKDPNLWHEWIENQLSAIPLYFFGKWSSKGSKLFPITSSIIEKIPNVRTAAISKLKANSQIQPHIGWGDLANSILRCHYGIDVPDNCGCVCDNFVVLHKTAEWLVFDDAKMHSSYNFSDKDRIVIILDMERPSYIPKGTSKVEYKKEILDFIESFYDKTDIQEIKNTINL
jgi:aspartyl/asparaginyl beta-hydroxylase (cupin superfamily)